MFGVIALVALLGATGPQGREARPGESLEGWGRTVDPDGDCHFVVGKGTLTIVVPGAQHNLGAEVAEMNAPRVLSEVNGDFIVDVEVAGRVRPAAESTSPRGYPYNGAGLLLWKDEATYVRLELAAILRDGVLVSYANFELREGGVVAHSKGLRIPDRATFLRLERRGGRVGAAVSEDGLKWMSFDPIAAELPAVVRVGVAAVNTSRGPFRGEFRGLTVFRKQADPPNP